MYNDIGVYDWQTLFILIESVTWVVIVLLALIFLTQQKSKLLTKGRKQNLWLAFAVWAISSIGFATLSTYSYYTTSREGFVDAIESQKSF